MIIDISHELRVRAASYETCLSESVHSETAVPRLRGASRGHDDVIEVPRARMHIAHGSSGDSDKRKRARHRPERPLEREPAKNRATLIALGGVRRESVRNPGLGGILRRWRVGRFQWA